MHIALTGGSGFIGRYIVARLARAGHELRCWYRPSSDRGGLDDVTSQLTWIEGQLGDPLTTASLVEGADAVVHAALDRPGPLFRGGEGGLDAFLERNLLGTVQLIQAARAAGCGRFVFVSTCAVHEQILDDRPLDEAHPLWPKSHYGAHKAALEMFVHSYGLGEGYPICALRPTGVYGVARPIERSKWYDLVAAVVRGQAVACRGGGKEVHAADVAEAIHRLLEADPQQLAGQAFNCYDRYVSQWDVARLAKQLAHSEAEIRGEQTRPKHQIQTGKLQALGMRFSGDQRLEETISALVEHCRP